MHKLYLWILCYLSVATGCAPTSNESHYLRYMAPPGMLQKGIVSKYYIHVKGKDGFSENTDIHYQRLELRHDTILLMTNYEVDFKVSSIQHFNIKQEGLLQSKNIRYTNGDSIHIESTEQYLLGENETGSVEDQFWPSNWVGKVHITAPTYLDSINEQEHYLIKKDSLLSNFTHPEREAVKGKNSRKTVYRENMGLWEQRMENEKDVVVMELIEQMSVESFEALWQHGLHRIGYIDPKSSLTPDSSFTLCGEESEIADYYNSQPDAHYSSKDSLRSLLTQDLQENQLKGESGYLTFRFVLNCMGETGRYITEEADLNFVPKKFDQEVKDLLLERLLKAHNWRSSKINNIGRDAYVYVTYKLKDGKIIELLP